MSGELVVSVNLRGYNYCHCGAFVAGRTPTPRYGVGGCPLPRERRRAGSPVGEIISERGHLRSESATLIALPLEGKASTQSTMNWLAPLLCQSVVVSALQRPPM